MSIYIRSILLFVFVCCGSLISQSVNVIDSLKLELENSISDTSRIDILNQLALEYQRDKNLENAVLYSDRAFILANEINHRARIQHTHYVAGSIFYKNYNYSKSLSHLFIALRIAEELKSKNKQSNALFLIGNNYKDIGKYEKALHFYEKGLQIDLEVNNIKDVAATYNNIGLVYWKQSSFEKALEYFHKSLEIKESLNDKQGVAGAYTNLGIIYYSLNNKGEALKIWEKCLTLWQELGDKVGTVEILNNIGALYSEMNQFEKALDYLKKALEVKEELGDKTGIAMTSGNIGEVYLNLKQYEQAHIYLLKSYKISKELGDNEGVIQSTFSISNYYNKKGNADSAIYYCELALSRANETGNLKFKKDAYELLSAIYENDKKFEKALINYKQYYAFADSIFNKNNSDKLAELQAKYESDKKEKEIELLNKTQIINEAELKKRMVLNYAFIVSIIFIVVIFLILFNRYRIKKKANDSLTYQNLIIEKHKEELISQKALLSKVNDELRHKNSLITDSLNYAKKIQDAILPSKESVQCIFPNFFILYRPKDIVSGDFYWYAFKNNTAYFAVVDCTGHGVPGAFMSMIGNTLLNDIINENTFSTPAQILEILNTRVIKALSQYSSTPTYQNDGMDISLFSYNKKINEIQLACVNQMAYIIEDEKITVIDGDVYSIGGGIGNHPNAVFTNHLIHLTKKTCLYISTDGYYDQFGGAENKKFMVSKFKELILQNHSKPMTEQEKIFAQTIQAWKGNKKQTDDILLAGFEL